MHGAASSRHILFIKHGKDEDRVGISVIFNIYVPQAKQKQAFPLYHVPNSQRFKSKNMSLIPVLTDNPHR
jgi:hypothetical protein